MIAFPLLSNVRHRAMVAPVSPPLARLIHIGKIHYWLPWKNSFRRAHAHMYVTFHQFCEKLCCITQTDNTVQQYQRGKQPIAGRQTVHGVFCQTITESCRNHCQVRNNIDEILPKFCNVFLLNDLLYHWTQY